MRLAPLLGLGLAAAAGLCVLLDAALYLPVPAFAAAYIALLCARQT